MQDTTEFGLVADIGGTNARFALAPIDPHATLTLQQPRRYRTADFSGIAEAAATYLKEVAHRTRPRCGMLAVASPVRDDHIRITNCPWQFTLSGLKRDLDVDHLQALNDFAALAHAVPALKPEERRIIGSRGPSSRSTALAVLGPGTGLGVSGIRSVDGQSLILDSEGGHCAFAPVTADEDRVLTALRSRYGRVSWERLLSGQGLVDIHAALNGTADSLGPEEITRRARTDGDAGCADAARIFCEILGSFAGEVALMFGAWDGVYLAGGLVAALLDTLTHGQAFRARFEAKGRFSAALASVPTYAITHAEPGLLGAAVALRRSGLQ